MADLVIPVGFGLWQFSMTHATIAHTAISGMGFSVATPPYTQANLNAALAAWATAVGPLHDAEVTYAKAVALIGNDGPAIRFESAGVATGGRAVVTISPPNVTYLVKKSTAFAGRRYRGRLYLPFVNSAGVTQTGQLSGAELTILSARATAISANLLGAGTGAGGLYLLHSESPLSELPLPTAIVNLTAETTVATQRRRLERS